jgi:hypothetical protein
MPGICNGPSVAIASLFPMPAVLAAEPAGLADSGMASVAASAADPSKTPVSPDIPPPGA